MDHESQWDLSKIEQKQRLHFSNKKSSQKQVFAQMHEPTWFLDLKVQGFINILFCDNIFFRLLLVAFYFLSVLLCRAVFDRV